MKNFAQLLASELDRCGVKRVPIDYATHGPIPVAGTGRKQFAAVQCENTDFGANNLVLVYCKKPAEFSYTEAAAVLARQVADEFGHWVRFHELVVPRRCVISTGVMVSDDVLVRQVTDYHIGSDSELTRYDVLVGRYG